MPYLAPNQPNPDDALLQALISVIGPSVLSSFGPRNIPNPGYGATVPGTGTQFGVAPAQPQGQLSPMQNPQQAMAGIRQPQAASPYSTSPLLNQQQFEHLKNLQAYQQQAAQGPVDLQYKQAQTSASNAQSRLFDRYLPPQNALQNATSASPAANPATNPMQKIADLADAGNPTAKAVMDYYFRVMEQ